MNLIIDAGNTLVKLAVFDAGTLLFHQSAKEEHVARQVKEIFDHYPKIDNAIVASVGVLDKMVIDVVSIFCKVHVVGRSTKIPYKNCYATTQTLGADRIALATAAFYHNPKGNTLVIDAGTCVTYDMVTAYGEYLGGAISPGLNMRYEALNEHTSKLPLLEPTDLLDFIGNSTESSIHSGVINGIIHEIDGVIGLYKSRFKDLTVILTGGDAQFLSKRLKNTIFAHPNFLLEGLNHLLDYNKR